MDNGPSSRTFSGHAVASRILAHMLNSPQAIHDLTVQVGSQTFPCHRAVLAASSPVFRAMFLSDMKESSSGLLDLPDDVPSQVFSAVRDFLYGRPLNVDDQHAIALSAFVRRYEISLPELSDFLDNLLASALTLDNVLHIREHANTHNAHRLRRACDRFITVRVNVLPQTPSFLDAEPLAVETTLRAPSFVSRDAVSRRCAQHVFQAAIAWLQHDESRLIHLDRILGAVDLNGLSLSALVRASRESIPSQSQAFQRRLLRAFATKAERDLRSVELTNSATGFAVVDDTDLQRAHRIDMLGGMPGSLCHVRRRASLGLPLVHTRVPRDSQRAGRRSRNRNDAMSDQIG